MSREQDSRRKAIDSARRNKAKGHQTRRARGDRNRREGKNAVRVKFYPKPKQSSLFRFRL